MMKNIKTIITVITVLVMIFLGVFYFTLYNSFTENTLSFIEVEYLGDAMNSDLKASKIHSEKIRLSSEEEMFFFQSIELKSDNLVENQNFAIIEDASEADEKTVVPFSMRLVNSFNQEKKYNIYLKNRKTAYIEYEGSFYEIEDPDFYYTHQGFDMYYKIKYLPKIESGKDVFFHPLHSENNWRAKRYDGSWVESNRSETEKKSPEKEETFLSLEKEEDQLKVLFNEAPDEITYTIVDINSDEELEKGTIDDIEAGILPRPEINGNYHYHVEAFWDHEIPTKSLISFTMDISLPIIFSIDQTTILQDDIIEITANRAASSAEVSINGDFTENLQWHREDQGLRSIIATNYHTDPGTYSLELKDLNSSIAHFYEIEVLPRNYKVQYLTIDSSIEERTRNEEAYEERDQYFTPVFKSSNEEKHYKGEFILPTEGRLTTEFGERRYVNDELTSYRHNGIDIAAPTGTEVLATNYGEVVFEKEMILMGNTIVIDHGHGFFSTYLHLHEIQVDKGEWVEKGDVIGTVGTTGFSTGPHLHFTLSYYDTPLEPGYFIINAPYTKEEHYQIKR